MTDIIILCPCSCLHTRSLFTSTDLYMDHQYKTNRTEQIEYSAIQQIQLVKIVHHKKGTQMCLPHHWVIGSLNSNDIRLVCGYTAITQKVMSSNLSMCLPISVVLLCKNINQVGWMSHRKYSAFQSVAFV